MLFTIMLIPLSFALAITLNLFSHWAFRSSEQVRLDAFVLSLCHSRAHFIRSQLLPANREIENLQVAMDLAAETCLAAPPQAKISICASSRQLIKSASLQGKGLEFSQNIRRHYFPSSERLLGVRLRKQNDLGAKRGRLEWIPKISLMNDGFSREKTSARRKHFEGVFPGSVWPQKLEINSTYEDLHTYRAEFWPKRILLGVPSDRGKAPGLGAREFQTTGKSPAKSRSRCQVSSDFKPRREPE